MMRRLKKYSGLLLMVVGVAMLAALHMLHMTFVNVLLFVPLLIILMGVVMHVRYVKSQSSY